MGSSTERPQLPFAAVPYRSIVWMPLVCDDSPLVEEFPIAVPSGWETALLPDAVRILHRHAAARDVSALVDVSGAGGLGSPLSNAVPRLLVDLGGAPTPLESVFCASMVFVGGGPYPELLSCSPGAARHDARLFSSGALLGFALPLPAAVVHRVPAWRWHAWLVVRALGRGPIPPNLLDAGGFTDAAAACSFGERTLAFSFAVAVALQQRSLFSLGFSYPGFARLLDARL